MSIDFFQISNPDKIDSPALIVDAERVQSNINKMIAIVDGGTSRLRPHVKTHKMADVVAMQVDLGITKYKTATLAEAEMVASAGGNEVLIAHQLVGPKIARLRKLVQQYSTVRFATIVDNLSTARQLSDEFSQCDSELSVYIDVDCGMTRSGIPLGSQCEELIQKIDFLDAIQFAGLHVYDGHLHQPSLELRRRAACQIIDQVREFTKLYPNCDVVGGGSPTFSTWATETQWTCSPGTPVFWDVGYGSAYPDLDFDIAAAILTRVISKPGNDLLCFDVGYKAVSSEMPLERRVVFPEIADATLVSHSEEHLVIQTKHTASVGDAFLAFPQHICPTVADHAAAHIVRWGNVTDEIWPVTARDR
ncbi:D-TA family PLP-dependent enzyme [Planctomycetes bacterium K23_9]|uniref:D-threonine aldolase n=1 Tax=Stieleria marina TaxID=1930275 RepID=A0A517P1C9_9BACT|nr:D-threonine aldolase [Planctomycetes bacterium K23_9]